MVTDDNIRVRVLCAGDLETGESEFRNDGQRKSGVPEINNNKGGRRKKTNPNRFLCLWTLLVLKDEISDTWKRHLFLLIMSSYPLILTEQIEENPSILVKAVQEQYQRKFEVEVSKMQAYRARSKAVQQLHGDFTSQYKLLRDYVGELMRRNRGTTIKLDLEVPSDSTSTNRKFKRIYICLGPLKEGFKAIGRDLLGLDGAFMKGPYPGQVLTAVGVDPNSGIYPLAYAIVEIENIDSWKWFLEYLRDDLNLDINSNFTFISYRQKGLCQAISTLFQELSIGFV